MYKYIYVAVTIYIYIYIYICSDCHFFTEESHLLNLQSISLVACVTPQAKYIFTSSIACVTSELAVFFIDIAPMHSQMTSQTFCTPTYFVTELTWALSLSLSLYIYIYIYICIKFSIKTNGVKKRRLCRKLNGHILV